MIDKNKIIQNLRHNNSKIDVLEFVSNYKKQADDNLKNKYLKDTVQIKPYIPFVEKMIIGKTIMKFSCFDENGNFYVDSCKKYISVVYQLIENYTNIYINPDDLQVGYDALCEEGLIEKIVAMIPEHEFKEINTVIQMSFDDVMTNTYENHAFICNLLKKYVPVIEKYLEPIADTVNQKLKEYKIELNKKEG